MVDVDGMGRAFPEIQMVTFHWWRVGKPMLFIDEKGNMGLMETISNKWVENICRAGCTACGGSVVSTEYVMTASRCASSACAASSRAARNWAVRFAASRTAPNMTPEEYFFDYTGGFRLFKGKIADVLRETRGGFNFGKVVLEGIGEERAAMRKSISRVRTCVRR